MYYVHCTLYKYYFQGALARRIILLAICQSSHFSKVKIHALHNTQYTCILRVPFKTI